MSEVKKSHSVNWRIYNTVKPFLHKESLFMTAQDILNNYKKAKKLLNNVKIWKGFKTLTNWKGGRGKVIEELHQILILESLYRLLWFYNEDESQNITLAELYRWSFEILGENTEHLAAETEKYWKQKIQADKARIHPVVDLLCNENPIAWLKLEQKNGKRCYYIETGDYADEFYKRMQSCKPLSRRSYKAPSELPLARKPSGKLAGKIRYAQLETGSQTEDVFQICERRHLWLRKDAMKIADKMTAQDADSVLSFYEEAIFFNRTEGYLSNNKRIGQKKRLRRLALLDKLRDFPPDEYFPLHNRFYSQSSGRIQSQWLHPGDISEKAGRSQEYPGGVRQAIFSCTEDGCDISAIDCNASAWQIVSILFGDEKTQKIACCKDFSFNDAMTERAIAGDYLISEKLQQPDGADNARALVKKLLMTVLYGSNANEQYKLAFSTGLGGYWQKPSQGKYNGAYRFLKDCKQDFPVLDYYVPLMQTVAKIACQKWGTLRLPYIFEQDAWLNFDRPKMKSTTIKTSRQFPKRKRQYYSVTLQFPDSPVENGRFVQADEKEIARSLPPTLIHSIDSAIVKHLILLLDREFPQRYGFATIHDCVIFPKEVISSDRIQELWNESLRLTYQSLGVLLSRIVEILSLNPDLSGKYLDIAREAYQKWQSNVCDRSFLARLWMSTSLEY